MLNIKLCRKLTGTDDTVISVTANLVSGQLCRPAAKFGSERESYTSPPDTLPLTLTHTHSHTYTLKQ